MAVKKKCLMILLICLGCIGAAISVILIAGLPWIGLGIGALFSDDPPLPDTTYGEFPFRLVYEYNGERITLEDTMIIEHKGVKWNEGLGKYNVWHVSYASQRETGQTDEDYNKLILFDGFIEGKGSAEIKFALGSCEYYMGLEEVEPYYKYLGIQPGDIVISSPKYTGPISNEELYSKYNIKIIEKYISPPITEKSKNY